MYTSASPVAGVHGGWPPSLRCFVRSRASRNFVGGTAVGHAVHEAADGLDAAGDEHVALARLDRVPMRIVCSDDEQ